MNERRFPVIYEMRIFKNYYKLIDYINIKKWNPSIIKRSHSAIDIYFSLLLHIFSSLFQHILVHKHPHLTNILSRCLMIQIQKMFQFKLFFPFLIHKTMKENGILGICLEIQYFQKVKENSQCSLSVILKNTPMSFNSKLIMDNLLI